MCTCTHFTYCTRMHAHMHARTPAHTHARFSMHVPHVHAQVGINTFSNIAGFLTGCDNDSFEFSCSYATTQDCEYRKAGCSPKNSLTQHFHSLGYVTRRFADSTAADFAAWSCEHLDHGILFVGDHNDLCTATPNVFTVYADVLRSMKRQVNTAVDRPAFSFSYFATYSHNANEKGWLLADEPLRRLLQQRAGENGAFRADRDFVYLLSDHGWNYGAFPRTPHGKEPRKSLSTKIFSLARLKHCPLPHHRLVASELTMILTAGLILPPWPSFS